MISPFAVFLIFLLPLLSFAIIALVIRPFFNHKSQYAGYLTIGGIAGSLALSIWTLASVSSDGPIATGPSDWISVGDTSIIQLRLMIDQLTAIMVLVVSLCSLMVQIYSVGYMHGDAGYSRYYAAMSLFTASMLGLVMAGNLLQLFVFWELVGLCSYLLIGFWFHKPSAAAAAKKAFLVTRIGDFGLLAAVLYLYTKTGTLDIAELHHMAITGEVIVGGVATWAAIGIFAGAVGKSAQFPLHVWLPDAMEGPTPVSSLIHSSTMVTAGVFLVARLFPVFAASETALMVVAGIGGFTAIFAASMALVNNDIKRVLAYCTVSQLGYMMLGLGSIGLVYFYGDHAEPLTEHLVLGVASIGIFHLFNHAFAKCLLFQASGSVNHATGTFDMREMGGLRKHMPRTYLVYLIGTISMAGIWPLACFWSKDHILVEAMEMNGAMQVFFYMGMITAFMTAFYMFRTLFMTFHGKYRGGASSNGHGGHGGLHESPMVMIFPMLILALMAISSGWLNANGWFTHFFGEESESSIVKNIFTMFTEHNALPLISLILALLGAGLAYSMYIRRQPEGETVGRIFPAPYKVFYRKYWMDELYERFFIVRVLINGLFRIIQTIDTYVVDGLVNGVGWGTLTDGRIMRKAQTGQLQVYGLVMLIGIVFIIGFVFLFAE